MGIVSLMATFTAFNAGILGTSRLVYAMAREGVLPGFLSRIHMTFFTPWSALVTIFCFQYTFALAIVYYGTFKVPIFMAASIECLIYTLVSPAVIRLRRWKNIFLPGFTALVFGALTILMMLPPTPYQVPLVLAAGLLMALAYTLLAVPYMDRLRQKSG
ncbi:MAG: amino acid permease [Peptococcaceae bacterium]|nr:amino acid permease [Peptococcaceae bacterium]